jgi:hypothetical protein
MQDNSAGGERKLDDFLAGYAAVEPRPGLEQRVVANLRANRHARTAPRIWRGAVLAIVTVIAAIALASSGWLVKMLRTDSRMRQAPALAAFIAGRPQLRGSAQTEGARRVTESAVPNRQAKARIHRLAANARLAIPADGEVAPKLAQFPAPEPLSEQEKLLVRFVQYDPREAELVAQERAEESQREAEEMKKFGEGAEGAQQ